MLNRFAALLLTLFAHVQHCEARVHKGWDRTWTAQASQSSPDTVAPGFKAAIVGPIDTDSLSASLAVISHAKDETITLYFDTPGGEGLATLAYIQAVKMYKAQNHVRLECSTGSLNASAGSIIYEAVCDVRHASDTTLWLFHGISAGGRGKAGDVEDAARMLRVMDMVVAKMVGPKLGMTPEQYIAWVDRTDRFLTTDELRKMGGCD